MVFSMSLKPRSVHRKYWFLRVLPHKMAFFNDNPCFRNFVWHEYWPFKGFTGTALPTFIHSLRAVPASRAPVGGPAFSRPQTRYCQRLWKSLRASLWVWSCRGSGFFNQSQRRSKLCAPAKEEAQGRGLRPKRFTNSPRCVEVQEKPSSSVAWRMCGSARET